MANPFRALPSVHEVLTELHEQWSEASAYPELATRLARAELARVRETLRNGAAPHAAPASADIARGVRAKLDAMLQPALVPVINATGVLIHTNLGRAPLAEEAVRAMESVGRGYTNLEMSLETGRRSSRQDAVRKWLCLLLDCESATVVNNNAAATVIALRALAREREVIVSRGELVEIGGSFRIPEIMAVSGAVLREVGTTNITRLADYAAAISEHTAALLRVHASNYRILGHTEAPSLAELVRLGNERGLPVIDDVGGGAMLDFSPFGLTDEPLPKVSLATGAALVLFSGDKLLGGPQAGILAGKKELIDRIEKDPLMRAFRLDKLTLAALEATLRIWLNQRERTDSLPLLRMIHAPLAALEERAEQLKAALAEASHLELVCRTTEAYVGGGTLPGRSLPSIALALRSQKLSADELATRLRRGSPAVVARIERDEVLLDLRGVFPGQDAELAAAIRSAASAECEANPT